METLSEDLLFLCKKPEVNTLIESPEVFLIIYPNDCPESEIKRNNCQMNKLKMKIYSSFLFKSSDYGESINDIESKLNILVMQELRKNGFDSCEKTGENNTKNKKETNNKTKKKQITTNNKTLKKQI